MQLSYVDQSRDDLKPDDNVWEAISGGAEVIVLGGGLSQIGALYEAVPRMWADHVFSDRVDTRLVPPRHGDSSGVRGAARLWPSGAGGP